MAFGFGPGSDMMKSVESNRKQMRKKKSLKQNIDTYNNGKNNEKLEFKKVSAEELERFKTQLLLKKKKEVKQNILLMIGVIIVVFSTFYFILF